jgi:hypothetical protein
VASLVETPEGLAVFFYVYLPKISGYLSLLVASARHV